MRVFFFLSFLNTIFGASLRQAHYISIIAKRNCRPDGVSDMSLLCSLLLLLIQAAFTLAGPFPRYVNSTFATAKTPTLMTDPGSAIHVKSISSTAPLTMSLQRHAHASASPESISDIRAWEQNADLWPTIDTTGPQSQSFTSTKHHWHFTYDPMPTQTSSSQSAANTIALSRESSSFIATSTASLDSYQHTIFKFEPSKTNTTVPSQSTRGVLRTPTNTRAETCNSSHFATSPSVSAHETGTTSVSGPAVYGSLTLTYHVSSDSEMGPIVASSFANTSAGQKSTSSSTTVQQLAPWTQSSYSVSPDSDQKTQMHPSWQFSYIPTMTTTTASLSHISRSSLQNHQQRSTETSRHSQLTSTSLSAATSDNSQYTTQPSHNLPEIVSQPSSSISASSTSSRSAKAGIVIVPIDPHALTVTVTTTTTEKEFGATTTLGN